MRYNRKSFPQDLSFQLTPNKENFQARYIVTHAAKGDFSCAAGKQYLKDLKQRREEEMDMLTYLSGKRYEDWDVVQNEEEKNIPASASYVQLAKEDHRKANNTLIYAMLGFAGVIVFFRLKRK